MEPLQETLDVNSLDASTAIQRKAVIKGLKSSGMRYWKVLKGTGWQADPEVVRAAVEQGLLIDTILWQDDAFVKSLFLRNDIKTSLAMHLWRKMSPRCRRQPCVAFQAWRSGYVTFRYLPKAIKRKSVLLKGLKNKEIHWSMLPEDDYQEDVDYFLINPDPNVFDDMIHEIEDRNKLFEWVLNDAQVDQLPDNSDYWFPGFVPDHVPASKSIMLRLAAKFPRAILLADDSLLRDEDFLSTAVQSNPNELLFFDTLIDGLDSMVSDDLRELVLDALAEQIFWVFKPLVSWRRITRIAI